MQWNDHYKLNGKHAIFNPSSPAWIGYSDDKALSYYDNMKAKERGTILHKWAKDTIDLGLKQPKTKKTLYLYVNDAIGYHMRTEQIVYYSDRFFGTCDAISFRDGYLRIHDLKTGKSPVHMEQLMVYAALFCLEYKKDPIDIDIELRIYQLDDVVVYNPSANEIDKIIHQIIHLEKVFSEIEEKEA